MIAVAIVRAVVVALVGAAAAAGASPGAARERAESAPQPRSAEADRLRVQVSPGFAYAPAVVRVQALVERAEDNRVLDVALDSGGYFRSSTIELEGAEAPKLHVVQFRSVPPGEFVVRVAVLGRSGNVRAVSEGRVVILE